MFNVWQTFFIEINYLSECLRHLTLDGPDSDRTKLMNLTEIYLIGVAGINNENFLEFICLQPSIEIFHHDKFALAGSTQTICEEMAKYC